MILIPLDQGALPLDSSNSKKKIMGKMFSILGAFAKFRKGTISFVISFCLPVYPHGRTQLPLDGFFIKFDMSIFRISVEKIQISSNYYKNNW
jgi:hypothetical protein